MDLAAKHAHVRACKVEIEAFYEGLFAGPTPGKYILHKPSPLLFLPLIIVDYPEEEEAERLFNVADADYNDLQVRLNKESTALTLLVKAYKALGLCLAKLQEASLNIYA